MRPWRSVSVTRGRSLGQVPLVASSVRGAGPSINRRKKTAQESQVTERHAEFQGRAAIKARRPGFHPSGEPPVLSKSTLRALKVRATQGAVEAYVLPLGELLQRPGRLTPRKGAGTSVEKLLRIGATSYDMLWMLCDSGPASHSSTSPPSHVLTRTHLRHPRTS